MPTLTNRQSSSGHPGSNQETHQWGFLTNHCQILVLLARDPNSRISELARELGVTQGTVQRILNELVADQILTVKKEGRRNSYTINHHKPLRHTVEGNRRIGELLDLLS